MKRRRKVIAIPKANGLDAECWPPRVLVSALTLSVVLLAGCATLARVDDMSATGSAQHRTLDTPLRNTLAIKDVTGGTETNPMWESQVSSSDFEKALEASLTSPQDSLRTAKRAISSSPPI